jgi:hypothetical protein
MANTANLYGAGSKSEDQSDTEKKPNVDIQVRRYWREIERYNRAVGDWYEEGENIEKVYLDEASPSRSSRRFALLWANTETLKPAVYTKTPTILCSRRYRDRDPVARTAAELMERATNTTLELYGVDEVFRMVRDDRLLPGRGTAWVRYEAVIDQIEETVMAFDAEQGIEVEQTEMREKLRSEKACVDYVHWQDFGHNIARTWSDVTIVWRCVYKTHEECVERFGAEKASRLSYNAKLPFGESANGQGDDNHVKIYEIWDRARGLVSWLAEGADHFLESDEPPINFSNFFPCPEPCYATKTSKTLIPKPDYVYYRDQAKEINDLTDKIGRLTQWLIVKGFIPGGPSTVSDPLEEALRDKGNTELFVQVDSFNEWTERGGAAKLIDWLPIQNVVQALQAAIQARAQLIQDVFQITGIADVLRGQSDPNETATAVDIRSQTGTRRLRNTKDDLARFCRDIARLTAETIAENFSPQSIAEITGYKYVPTPDPMMVPGNMANVAMFPGAQMPMVPQMPQMRQMPGSPMMPQMGMGQQMPQMPQNPMMNHNGGPPMGEESEPGLTFDDRVIALLRDDKLRSFRVDVETDSTLQADENAEKSAANEYITAMVGALKVAAEVVQTAPAFTDTIGELMMMGARRHRVGRNMEETIERNFATMAREAEQARSQPKPEDPVIQVAKVQVQGEIEKNRANAALKAKELQQDAQLEIRKQNLDAALEIRDQDIQATAKARDAAARMSVRVPNMGLAR